MAVDVSMWSSEAWTSAADMYLLARTREGSDEAFAELWRRHLPAAYAVAVRYGGRGSAEDLVAEAATRVLALIKEGRGPEENFRAYFLSAVRSVAVDSGRRELRVVPIADDDLDALLEPVVDGDPDDFDPDLVRAAFHELSEKDQRVLWHTTVEGEAPRVVAPLMGMTANAVSVRAMRAREALRVNYLEAYAAQHLPGAQTPECRWAIGVLGSHARGRLPKRATDRLEEHLDGCAHETALLGRLLTIQERFPALVVPLLFLAGTSSTGFLAGAALAGFGGAAAAGAPDGSEAAEAVGAVEGVDGIEGADGAAPGLESGGEVAETPGVLEELLAASEGADAQVAGSGASGQTADSAQRGGDAVGALVGRVTGLAAGLLIAAGLLAAGPAPLTEVAAGPATPGSTTASGPSSSSGSSSSSSSTTSGTTSTPATTAPTTAPTTAATTTATARATVAPAVRPTAVSVTASRAPTAAPPQTTGPAIDLRVISSGTPTRFSVRFSTATDGELRVTVANASGGGRLTAENGAFSCGGSGSAVTCTGRGGHIMLEQSGLSSPQPVVVRVTDSAGRTTTQTFSLR